jgi:electron transfer flavoprotein beta subunit
MKIIVCIKQVPDTEAAITVDPRTRQVLTKGITYILNPYDELAIEEAVRIKEKHPGSEVTAVTYGALVTEKALRACLAMGADHAVMITDEAAEETDTLSKAYIIATAIKKMEYDLILCGKRSLDSDTNQLAPSLAEYLKIPSISPVTKIEIDMEKNIIKAHRQIEGMMEVLECKLPALLAAERGLNEPRAPTLPALMKAKKAKIKMVELNDIGINRSELVLEGSKVKVLNYSLPKPRKDKSTQDLSKLSASERLRIAMSGGMEEKGGSDKIIKGDYKECANKIVEFLSQNKFVSI